MAEAGTVAGEGVEVAGSEGTSITESLTINELLSSPEGYRGWGWKGHVYYMYVARIVFVRVALSVIC